MDDFDSAAGAVAGGDFDRAAADTVHAQQQPARESLYGALLANPDVAARATRLGRKVGLPADLVERNLPEVERDARLNEFDRVLLNSPVTAKWVAADKARARMANDNVDNMGEIERKLRQFGGGAVEAAGMAASGTGQLLDIAQRNLLGGFARVFLPKPMSGGEINYDSIVGPLLGEDWIRAGGAVKGFARNDMMIPAAQQTFGDQVASGLGQVGMQILMLPLTRGAGLYTQGADTMAEKIAPDIADQGMKDLAVLGGAAVTGITEKWALDKLLGPLAVPIKNKIAASLARVGIASAAEGGQEISENLLQDTLRVILTNPNAKIDVGQSFDEGGVGAAVGGIVRSIVEAGLHIRVRGERRAQQAEQDAEFFDGLNKLAAADKLLARDPETFQQFIAMAAEDGPVQQVFIDAQTLMQSGVAEQVAAVSPAVATQLREALQTGGQIAIPVEEYAARIAPTEYAQSMADHLKTDPEGFSRAEAQEYLQSDYAQELQAQVERVLGEKQGDETFRASTEAVRANIKAQLTTAGRFTESVNDAYSSMVGNFYAVQAARMGTTPEEMFKRYPLRIGAESIAGQQFDQGRTLQQLRDDLQKQQAGFDAYDAEIRGGIDPDGNKYFGLADKVTEAMDAFVADLEQIPDDSFSLQAKTRDGRLLLVNPSAQKPGHYQLTRFASDGNPWGDTQYPTKKQAIKDFLDESDASTVKDFGGQLNQSARLNTDTPEFRKWFGDSKVVDSDGKPLVVYHGTDSIFTEFSRSGDIGYHFGTEIAAKERAAKFGSAGVLVEPITLRQVDKDSLAALNGEIGGNPSDELYALLLRKLDSPRQDLREKIAEMSDSEISDAKDEYLNQPDSNRFIDRIERAKAGDGYRVEVKGEVVSTHKTAREANSRASRLREKASNPMAVFLSIKNPIRMPDLGVWPAQEIANEAGFSRDEKALVADAGYASEQYAEVVRILESKGYDGVVYRNEVENVGEDSYIAFNPTQIKSAIGNRGTFDPNDANILNQQARASFNPATLQMSLLKNADLSSFLHESGHFFLEVQFDIAAQLQKEAAIHGADTLKEGEQEYLRDTKAVLDWFGINDLAEWNNLDFEEKRSYHEKFARGFESYLFEGEAPSIELQGLFQRFRAWMLNVYRDLKALNVELTDEVRGVFDRMLATNEEIALAEQGRSMMPLFTSDEQIGMTPAEFADYQALGVDATNEAIQELQARGLRDLAYSRNARGRIIKQLQKDAAAKRAGVQLEARRDVMSQPIYRAWQFLTGKITADDKIEPVTPPKSDPNVLDETIDSLFVAIAKLGGINKDETISTWGIDPADKPASGVFGKPVWRIGSAGLSLDGMAEALGQYGYLDLDEHGKVDLRDLEEKFRAELGGESIYSIAFDYSGQQPVRAGDQLANPGALSAGRLDLDSLADLGLPPEVVAAVKARRMTARDGLHPDIVAELIVDENGNPLFTSGDELVRQLAVATPPGEAIDALTDQRMLEQFGELSTPEAIDRAADIAIHNEVRARFVATELAALEKATGNRKTLASAAKEYAAAMIARLKVRDIKPGQYAAGEVRAAKATAKAIKAGDLATAAAEKRNQLIQNYAARAAYDAQEEVEKGLRYFGRVEKSATIDREYIEQIHALLERYDLRKAVSGKAIDRQASLRTWVQAQLNAGELPLIAESLLTPAERSAYVAQIESRGVDGELVYADDEERIKLLADAIDRSEKRSYKELTVEEFRGLVDTIQQIEHLGRLKHKMLTARDDAAYEAVRDEIAGSIATESSASGKNTRTANDWLGQKLQAIKQFGAAHIKVATWARIMDGGKDNGPVWRYFVQPANERASQETTMRAEATEKLDAILRPIMSKVSMADKMGKGKFFPTLNDSLNWQERFTILLNLGNESNTQRLLAGKGWSMAQIMPVLNTFSAEELRAAQAIWDHFEGYRPLIAAKELRVTGKEPEWIPARQIAIKASDGQIVTLRGGYYPVVYDPRVNLKASQHSSAEEAKNLLKASYSAATTRRSFTKSRVEEVHGRPILLNMQGLYSGVNDVIHDLAWHEWVIDANKLLRSNTIDTAIREHYGPEVKREFEKWRDDIVAGNRRLDHAIEKAAGWARQSVTASALTFNIVSAAMQPLGIANSISRVGAHWIGKGIARYVGAPFESTREAQEKSEWMANRARTRFRELNELRNQVQGQTAIKELMGRYGYWMMMRTQMMVDVPTWWGAYEKAIADGHDETTAVNLADQSVKDSQGGGEEVDQSGVERGGPLVKLFTAFYGFMGTTLNTAYLNGKTEKSRAKMAVNMLLVLGVPAVVGSLLKSALVPGDDGDDDKLAKKLIIEQLSFLAGLIAFGREFTPLIKAVAGESKGQSYSGPTGLRVIPDTINLGKQAGQGEFDDAFRKAFINVAGDLTGVPSVQINRSITGIKAIADGKTENPFAVAFGFQEKR